MAIAKEAKGAERFHDYWRLWGKHGAGDRSTIFDSRESIGIGHYRLWKFLIIERRCWRKCLHSTYGFNVHTGQFMASRSGGIATQEVLVLEEPPIEGEQTSQDVLSRWSRRRQCLRHPFYQALEQYLAVCECLEGCGDPPPLLANPHFAQYSERRLLLTINGAQHVKSALVQEMRLTDSLPGETWGAYINRPHKHFRCRDMKAAFHNVYMPITKILDMESGPDGDTDQFFGSFADTGINLTKDVRLKAALKEVGADPYQIKRQLLPSVVMSKVVPKLLEIVDPLNREAAFRKLPGKTAYALGQVVGVIPKKYKRPSGVEPTENVISDEASLHKQLVRELRKDQLTPRRSEFQDNQNKIMLQCLAELSAGQREVYILHEVDKLTLKAIAFQLDIAPGTAASHYSRAKVKVKIMQKTIK
jgi:RNA polymerase sigma factor (sigma-70 family)